MAESSLKAVLDFLKYKFPDAFKALNASLLDVESGAPAEHSKSGSSTGDASLPSSDVEDMELDSPMSPENPEDAGGLFTEVYNKKKRKKRSSPASSSPSSSSSSPVPQKAPRPHSPLESSQSAPIPALMATPVEPPKTAPFNSSPQSPIARPALPVARALHSKKPPPIYIQAKDKWPMIKSALSNKIECVATPTQQDSRNLRRDPSHIPREALEWIPLGTRRRGRPKQTWRRSVAADMKAIELTWPETKRRAQDRANWQRTVDALCPTAGI
ncbi:PREDICTED: putative protein TPRXL [Papilio xuthus]|uniref:Uncharacterized protein n=1 Tax=Papilio xuthus TaxID=66420 RepID=A0AAJ6ZJB2_PAPXU|nr:PREDICTED: putative protein TPRXL [Papilio xuthus]